MIDIPKEAYLTPEEVDNIYAECGRLSLPHTKILKYYLLSANSSLSCYYSDNSRDNNTNSNC